MSSSDMNHMKYLAAIATSDVAVLEVKESTYRGSWKKRGGVGAFMMMARKWDRIENILGSQWKYDILVAMNEQSSVAREQGLDPGGDGLVLAEVRDLRRYLLLIEAEMMATDAAQRKPTIEELEKILQEPDRGGIGEFALDDVSPSVRVCPDGSVTTDEFTRSERRVPRYSPVNNDSEVDRPWLVGQDYFIGMNKSIQDLFWHKRTPAVWVLEPYVVSDILPRVLHGYYDMNGDHSWTLKIKRAPVSVRSYFPDLSREKNMKEHEELPEWQRWLYAWDKDGQKFRLTDGNAAWHVEN